MFGFYTVFLWLLKLGAVLNFYLLVSTAAIPSTTPRSAASPTCFLPLEEEYEEEG